MLNTLVFDQALLGNYIINKKNYYLNRRCYCSHHSSHPTHEGISHGKGSYFLTKCKYSIKRSLYRRSDRRAAQRFWNKMDIDRAFGKKTHFRLNERGTSLYVLLLLLSFRYNSQ